MNCGLSADTEFGQSYKHKETASRAATPIIVFHVDARCLNEDEESRFLILWSVYGGFTTLMNSTAYA